MNLFKFIQGVYVAQVDLFYSLGHAEVVKLLLSRGVPVDLEVYCGTPLHLAASHGNESVLKILLEHGADVSCLFCGLFFVYETSTKLFIQYMLCQSNIFCFIFRSIISFILS
jgi:ankyrin repeat protein